MDFSSYLEKKNISIAEASKQLGVSYETVRSYRCGLRRPNLEGIEFIKIWSKGCVSYEDWLSEDKTL